MSCVKVEVAVLGSLSLIVLMVESVMQSNTKFKRFSILQECGTAKSDVSTYCGVMLEYTV